MNETQKVLLKNEITIQFSKAKLEVEKLKKIQKEERQKFVDIKLLEVYDAALRWALQKQIVTQMELSTNKFFVDNNHSYENILKGAIATTGVVSSGIAFSVATAPTFLGFGGGISAIGLASGAAIAAPLAVVVLSIYGLKKFKDHKQYEKLVEYFEIEKNKILEFYLNKIDGLKLLDK